MREIPSLTYPFFKTFFTLKNMQDKKRVKSDISDIFDSLRRTLTYSNNKFHLPIQNDKNFGCILNKQRQDRGAVSKKKKMPCDLLLVY